MTVAPAQAKAAASPADVRQAQARARGEAQRARERAEAFDRQARASNQAGERATIEAAALAARVEQTEAALAGAEASLMLIRERRRALDRRLAEDRAPVARLMAGLQTLFRRPALLTLAQPGSLQDAVHLRAIAAAIEPQIDARTAALRGALTQARAFERQSTQAVVQKRQLQRMLEARRGELAALSAAERLKAQRAAGAADREAERAFALAAQSRNPASLVRRISTQVPVEPSYRGRSAAPAAAKLDPYRLPVTGIAASTSGGGVTLSPRPGAIVVAPAAGRIAFAGPYRGYGAIVIVEHSGGWASLVTGLASAQVRVGQAVIGGSPLGQAPQRNPRIGLELRRNGERVNPLDQMR